MNDLPHPLKPLLPVPAEGHLPPWAWVAIAVAAGAGCLWLWRRAKGRLAPPLTPYEAALAALKACEGHVKDPDADGRLAAALSQALRQYLEAQLGPQVAGRTTQEFQAALPSSLPEAEATALIAFLEHCDLIKFAQKALPPADRPGLIERALTLLNAFKAYLEVPTASHAKEYPQRPIQA